MIDMRTLSVETVNKVGETVTLKGWVDTKRDHGKLTFIDLRDHAGKVQCVGFAKMGELSTESVVSITGKINQRPENMVNDKILTGRVEVEVVDYKVLNTAITLPIQIDGDGKNLAEELRLKYRYLDLRRNRMQKILKLRSDYFFELRKSLAAQEFTEVETPILSKATKEGARDFLVPSRFQPGKFYALPQSPQQYKQLLMAAGIYRYFQFARCFRDEDLRADRGFEFTQLDMELSFVTRDEVMKIIEKVVIESVKAVGGKLKFDKFPIYTYKQAIEQFGADKFDLRTQEEKEAGVLAFAWVVDFPMFKKVDKGDAAEVSDGKSGWTFTHNPFGSPKKDDVEKHLKGEDVANILTDQYDLVCNGFEAGGGSIRAHNPEVLKATYKIMGYSEVEIEASIGHMLEAFGYGTPPHGGIALGLDRIVMMLANENSLKETIPFPMTSTGRTAVMEAPAVVDDTQLEVFGLKTAIKTFNNVYDQIIDALKTNLVEYQEFNHPPTITSEESAKIRGTEIHQGSKALILTDGKTQLMYVLPADLRADLKLLAVKLNVKRLEMVSLDKIEVQTGLPKGSIPPFGSLLKMKTVVDSRMSENFEIAFNAGRLDKSIKIKYSDYIKIEKPTIINLE